MIRPIFGTDITHNKDNRAIDGDVFITDSAPAELTQWLKDAEDSFENVFNTKNIRKNMMYLTASSIIVITALILITFLKDLYKPGGVPVFPIIGFVLVAVYIVINRVITKRLEAALRSDEITKGILKVETLKQLVCMSFGLAEDAPDTDILHVDYKDKTGKTVRRIIDSYTNVGMKLYRSGNSLCIIHGSSKYEIPLGEISEIRTVKKSISVLGWNKDTKCDEGEYKKYKLKEDRHGFVKIRQHYILVINRNGEEYGLYFPNYELPAMEELTGIKV